VQKRLVVGKEVGHHVGFIIYTYSTVYSYVPATPLNALLNFKPKVEAIATSR